ncbi:hypothetical protein ACTMU2_23275 [Cupriavidus basilensis]
MGAGVGPLAGAAVGADAVPSTRATVRSGTMTRPTRNACAASGHRCAGPRQHGNGGAAGPSYYHPPPPPPLGVRQHRADQFSYSGVLRLFADPSARPRAAAPHRHTSRQAVMSSAAYRVGSSPRW